MNRAAFFAALRSRGNTLFGTSLSQKQVEGVEAILDEAEHRGTSVFHLSAILAEVHHETGGQMQPVKETVYASSKDRNPSDETVIKRLDTAFAKGKLPWVKTPYWRDGWFGRGLVQITHERNYRKLNLTKQSALDLRTSVRATFDGMEQGLFTGKKLSDYDYIVTKVPEVKGYRYFSSRAIINGDTPAMGAKIDRSAKSFEKALRDAGYDPELSKATEAPKPAPAPTSPETKPIVIDRKAGKADWLTALLNAILALFKGGRNAS